MPVDSRHAHTRHRHCWVLPGWAVSALRPTTTRHSQHARPRNLLLLRQPPWGRRPRRWRCLQHPVCPESRRHCEHLGHRQDRPRLAPRQPLLSLRPHQPRPELVAALAARPSVLGHHHHRHRHRRCRRKLQWHRFRPPQPRLVRLVEHITRLLSLGHHRHYSPWHCKQRRRKGLRRRCRPPQPRPVRPV